MDKGNDLSLEVNDNNLDNDLLSKTYYNLETEGESLLHDDNTFDVDGDEYLISMNKKNKSNTYKTTSTKGSKLSNFCIIILLILLAISSYPHLYKRFGPKEKIYNNIYEETLYENVASKNLTGIKISVITSVYNTEDLVGRAIQSALNQTIKDVEVILINDGSKDNSVKEILKFVDKSPRVRLISLAKNGGQGRARNRGLKLVRGEFIGFLDSDDEITPTFYEDLYSHSKEYDVVMGKMASGTNNSPNYKPNTMPNPFIHGYCGDSIWRTSFIFEHNIEFSNKRIAEDMDFRINCYEHNPRLFNQTTEESYYIYRLREGSMCGFTEERIKNNDKSIAEYMEQNKDRINNIENKINENKNEENKNEENKNEENKNEDSNNKENETDKTQNNDAKNNNNENNDTKNDDDKKDENKKEYGNN